MSDPKLVLNGINALTGQYLVPPMTLDEAAGQARGDQVPAPRANWLRRLADWITQRPFALPAEIDDPNDLSQVGWGVVYSKGVSPTVRAALKPLLDRRQAQAGDKFKVFDYQAGESRETWLGRHGAHGADVVPENVPFFLLIVGDPGEMPFEFQCLLDIDYAVGRLAFDDPADYGRYAQAVIDYETSAAVPTGREVVYWGTRHDMDAATELSADDLVTPLNGPYPKAGDPTVAARFKFGSRCLLAADATKANLLQVLGGKDKPRPAVVFTASHGMGGWPKGDKRARPANGALLCQDWPGFGACKPAHYLTAAELDNTVRLQGTIAFLFACYGAGTPKYDAYLKDPAGGPVEVADAPFVSALGQRMLSAGALAVVGHVERAWAYSLTAAQAGPQIQPFRNLMIRLLQGQRVGQSTLDFSQRYATYSADLLNLLDPGRPDASKPTAIDLVGRWIERNDAQNYVVLGDPAVRLRVEDMKN
jgi:hypothetical protein